MSVCPKCGAHINLLHLGQNCPKCSVNMRFYGFDERFYRDAKKAELSMANVAVKIRRAKVALIGGKLPISRLCLMLLPLLSLLIPYANISMSLPFSQTNFVLSALGVFGAYSDGTVGLIFKLTGSSVCAAEFIALAKAVIAFALTAVFAVLTFLMTVLCFFSIKKMSAVLCVTSALGIASSVACAVFASSFCNVSSQMLSGSMSFGYVITAVFFAAIFAVNTVIAVKGLPVEYEEGDFERWMIYKQVRKGEINIDDLPQPIVETAQTRAIDDEIRKQQETYREKAEEGGAVADEKI